MKKNEKGFFLAETIIVLALITTVLAYVYPNTAKLYETYKNKVRYYDQTQDVYYLRSLVPFLVSYVNEDDINVKNPNSVIKGCSDLSILSSIKFSDVDNIGVLSQKSIYSNSFNYAGNLKELYVTSYIATPTTTTTKNLNFKSYLLKLRKKDYENISCRLIGVFEQKVDGKLEQRYASIKVYDPAKSDSLNGGWYYENQNR